MHIMNSWAVAQMRFFAIASVFATVDIAKPELWETLVRPCFEQADVPEIAAAESPFL